MDHDDMGMMECMPMPMLFCDTWPFQIMWTWWNVKDTRSYAGSFIVCMLMGMFRHFLARLRFDLIGANLPHARTGHGHVQNDPAYNEDASTGLLSGARGLALGAAFVPRARLQARFLQENQWLLRILDVLLFGAGAVMGFLNMLVVMAMNSGIMMAIIIGEMVGVLLFEPMGGIAGASLSVANELAGTSCH